MISLRTSIAQPFQIIRPVQIGQGVLAAHFGNRTSAGLGGFPVPGATGIVSGDPSGHWQVLAGLLTPTATGEGALAATYELGLDTGQTVVVTVTAGAATIAPEGPTGCDQLTRYIDPTAPGAVDWSAGGTIYLRPGTYDTRAAYGGDDPDDARMMDTFHLSMGATTIRSAGPTPAVLTGYQLGGNSQVSGIALRDLYLAGTQKTSSGWAGIQTGLPVQRIVNFLNATNCSVIDCEIVGDLVHFDEGGRSFDTLTGITVSPDSDTITIQGNSVRNVHLGIGVQGPDCSVLENAVSNVHGDFFNYATTAHRLVMKRNVSHDAIGDPTYRHMDWIQFNVSGGAVEDIEIAENLHWSGGKERINARQGDSLNGPALLGFTNDAAYQAANSGSYTLIGDTFTLDDTHMGMHVRLAPADGTTITVSLPDAASNDGKVWCVDRISAAGNGTVAFSFAGSDTHVDGAPTLTGNTAQFSARSDGTTQWQTQYNGRFYYELMTLATRTLQPWHRNRGTVIDTSAGDVTITIPAGATDHEYNIRRVWSASGACTVQTTGGEAMIFGDGSTATSFSLAIGDSYRVVWNGTGWTMNRRSSTNMGIFSNGACLRGEIRNNVALLRSATGLKFEGGAPETIVANNTLIYQPDEDDFGPEDCNISANAAGMQVFGNLLGGTVQTSGGALAAHNVEIAAGDDADFSAVYAIFGGTSIGDLIPADRTQAVSIVRPLAGTAPVTQFAGALGLTDLEGALNTTALTPNVGNYPAPVVESINPISGGAIGGTASITITFSDFIRFGTGNVVLYDVTGGVAEQTFDVSTSPQVVISGRDLIITPSPALPETVVSVRIDATAIESESYGTSFAGIADDTYSYTVEASALSAWPLVNADGATHLRKSPYGVAGSTKTLVLALSHTPNIGGSNRANILYRDDARLDVFYRRSTSQFQVVYEGISLTWSGVTITNGVPTTILLTIDSAQATSGAGAVLYVNGTSYAPPATTWTQDTTLDLAATDLLLFQNEDVANRTMKGNIGMLFMDRPATVPDLTDPAVRGLFEAAALDGDNTGPTGRVPEILMYGDAATWNAGLNRGFAGDFQITGTFADA